MACLTIHATVANVATSRPRASSSAARSVTLVARVAGGREPRHQPASRHGRRPSLPSSASATNRRGVLQRRPHDLGRIDDPGLDHVLELAGLRVEAPVVLVLSPAPCRKSRHHPRPRSRRSAATAFAPPCARSRCRRAGRRCRPSVWPGSATPAPEPRRRRERCLPRPPRVSRADRHRRGPSSPSPRPRWSRRRE